MSRVLKSSKALTSQPTPDATSARAPGSSPSSKSGDERTPHPIAVRTGAKRPAQTSGNKIDILVSMLRVKGGASINELVKATGWQAHSVRGSISGQLKRKLGLKVASEKIDGTRRYRIVK